MDAHNSLERLRFAQFRTRVIQPTLAFLGPKFESDAAINLLLGTVAQETQLAFYAQYPTGPGAGPYSIEPATHDDVADRYLMFPRNADLRGKVLQLLAAYPNRHLQLASNAAYATAIARIRYYEVEEPMPAADDIDGMGKYWKRYYNGGGAGQVSEFVSNYRRFIGG